MRTVILDTEADGLEPTQVWCAVGKVWGAPDEITRFRPDDLHKLPAYLDGFDRIVGHNMVGYDARKVFPLLGYHRPVDDLVDTLILSQLHEPTRRDGYGAHALDAWGWRLGIMKPKHNEWDKFSEAMLVRCEQDVEITYLLFRRLLKLLKGGTKISSRVEHDMREFLDEMKETGFYFDMKKGKALYNTVFQRAGVLRAALESTVPPLPKQGKAVELKITKAGRVNRSNQQRITTWLDLNRDTGLFPEQELDDVVCGVYTLVDFTPFDPSSTHQIVAAMDRYGWRPTRKTKTKKSWAVTEDNLDTLPDDAPSCAKDIPIFMACESRHKLLKGLIEAASLRNDSTVHGSVLGLGTSTHRGSHRDPNMANIPGIESKYYGVECRELFTVEHPVKWVKHEDGRYSFSEEGEYVLLGCDAQGIQLRIFAHLTGSKEYGEKVLNDPHSANLEALGIPKGEYDEHSGTYPLARQRAKKFIYAWLLGAGPVMAGLILDISTAQAKEAIANFLDKTPGLRKLKTYLKACARRGYMPLVDGRLAKLTSEFLAMSVALQGNEAAIMKRALVDWRKEYKRRGLDVRPVAWVHDEIQAVVHKDVAEEAGELMNQAIRDAGVTYKLKCPMDGSFKIGVTWKDTH